MEDKGQGRNLFSPLRYCLSIFTGKLTNSIRSLGDNGHNTGAVATQVGQFRLVDK